MTLSKEEKRDKAALVQMHDIALNAAYSVALKLAHEDYESGMIEEEGKPLRTASYYENFQKHIGDRPEMPPTPTKLFNRNS